MTLKTERAWNLFYGERCSCMVIVDSRMTWIYRVVQKTDTQFYLWDNLSNSAPILTILSLLQAKIYGAWTWSSSTHHTFIVLPPYLAKQTLLLISVLSVLFCWLNLSFGSIKMMCGCSSQVAMLDVSAAILVTASRRRRHSLRLLSMKRCESFCHSVTIARFSSSTVLNCRWW